MSLYLVTGAAGFIGSNLVHSLVERGESVRALDDLSTGYRVNVDEFPKSVEYVQGSILDRDLLGKTMRGVDYVLHQAAIPSVPRSVDDPIPSCKVNIEGAVNVFLAARDAEVKRVVAASSSSVCGNSQPGLSDESLPLDPISPYAVSKAAMETYARVFSKLYDIDIVCLRYFNVFGPRQSPRSAYAAVIPLFIDRLARGEHPVVHGDGSQSRDFTYVENVVEGNLAACRAERPIAGIYNLACGESTSVLELAELLMDIMGVHVAPGHGPARAGDIHFSKANIAKARSVLGYEPRVSLRDGLERTVAWYRSSN